MRISDWSSDVCSSDLVRTELGKGFEDETERVFQLEANGRVVNGFDGLHRGEQLLPHAVALTPALERRNAILGPYGRAVMPSQSVAQPEGPFELVVAPGPGIDHLRLRLEVLV